MDKSYTHNKRPAIAFDNIQEAKLIKTALLNFKAVAFYYSSADTKYESLINRIELLLDELEKVIKMFNKKE